MLAVQGLLRQILEQNTVEQNTVEPIMCRPYSVDTKMRPHMVTGQTVIGLILPCFKAGG